MFRAMLYGSYKKPRELIWLIGMLIFLVFVGLTFGRSMGGGRLRGRRGGVFIGPGFGGGGASGKRSLEGTFLSGCILTARKAAAAIDRYLGW